MLLINPHTSFFFREEAQMVSEEGLNAYGALTWGQFFIYQGFNDKAGWMHTSSSVDNIDEYLETITTKADGSYTYRVGTEERPLIVKKIVIPYKSDTGMKQIEFTTYRTHRGPIVRKADGKWVSVRLMEEPMKALIQSYSRTKARNLAEYKKVMDSAHQLVEQHALRRRRRQHRVLPFELHPEARRQVRLDQAGRRQQSGDRVERRAVVRRIAERRQSEERLGLQHQQLSVLGGRSRQQPEAEAFPKYVDSGSENPRGVHAIKVLTGKKGLTLDTLITDVAFDSYQPEFEIQIPLLLKAHAATPASNPLKAKTADAIAVLKDWDYRWWATSVPQAVAIFYGDDLWTRVQAEARKANVPVYEYMKSKVTPQQRLESLAAAMDKLAADFGKWQTPWGDINRFQRNDGAIVQKFDDSKPSTPVMFASATLGFARLVRRARVSGHQEVVRHQRQQLRGGDRVRRPGEGEGGDRRRPEQRAGLEALQRSGRALRDRQPARRLLLSRSAQGPHRARIQAGPIT